MRAVKQQLSRPKNRTAPGRKSSGRIKLGRDIRLRIAKEAKGLGLSSHEYMRLVLALSSALRRGLTKGKKVDARALVTVVDNPFFQAMIRYVSETALRDTNPADPQVKTDSSGHGPQGQERTEAPSADPSTHGQQPNRQPLQPWGQPMAPWHEIEPVQPTPYIPYPPQILPEPNRPQNPYPTPPNTTQPSQPAMDPLDFW